MKLHVFFFIILIISSCDKYPTGCDKNSHTYISVKNSNVSAIYFTDRKTPLMLDYDFKNFQEYTLLKPNEIKKKYLGNNYCYELNFNEIQSRTFYFYDAVVLDKNLWSDVVKNNLGILDSIKVDLDYMQKNNWIVDYK
jgi:hypothetical protein